MSLFAQLKADLVDVLGSLRDLLDMFLFIVGESKESS